MTIEQDHQPVALFLGQGICVEGDASKELTFARFQRHACRKQAHCRTLVLNHAGAPPKQGRRPSQRCIREIPQHVAVADEEQK